MKLRHRIGIYLSVREKEKELMEPAGESLKLDTLGIGRIGPIYIRVFFFCFSTISIL